MTEQELVDLKAEIEESKENISKMTGRKEAMEEQLLKTYGVKTIAAAEKKLKEIEKSILTWDDKIQEATEDLELILYGDGTESKA